MSRIENREWMGDGTRIVATGLVIEMFPNLKTNKNFIRHIEIINLCCHIFPWNFPFF